MVLPSITLEVKDLKTFITTDEGIVRAVNGASFVVNSQTTLGILGESGCGKTMMGNSIMQILPRNARVESGQILYYPKDGQKPVDIVKLDRHGKTMARLRRKEISMIFQEPMTAFSPVYTVGNQITEAILLYDPKMTYKAARKKAIELLHHVGLPRPERIVNQYPFELSGGMRQRSMIAMALASEPKLLIADEPTTAIDVTIQAQVLELLKRLQQELGMSVVIITHNLGVVAELAQNVAVMYRGKVVESGSIDDVISHPAHPYTQALLRSIPGMAIRRQELEVIRGTVPDPYIRLTGCEFGPRCNHRLDICSRVTPGITQLREGHETRCFLYGDAKEKVSDEVTVV